MPPVRLSVGTALGHHQPLTAASKWKTLHHPGIPSPVLHPPSREGFHNENLIRLPTLQPCLIVFNGFPLIKAESVKSLIATMGPCPVWHLPAPPAPSPSPSPSLSTLQPLSGITYAPDPHLRAQPWCSGGCVHLPSLFP